jgi:DNA-binding PadR family transcriptional regulator
MRRKTGSLVPIEVAVLDAAIDLRRRGMPTFYGFLIAREIKERVQARLLTAHGTLYKALDRMERAGLLESFWEDPNSAAADGRPRRRFYQITMVGEAALALANTEARTGAPALRRKPAES